MTDKKHEITKSWYEDISYVFLKRSAPAVLTIGGEDYPGFVQKFQKPYDPIFLNAMQETLKYLCESIPGCILGYTHAFECTLVLAAPKQIETPSWFNLDVQKIVSLAAGMASMKFNKCFEKTAKTYVMAGNNFDETKKLSAMQGYVSAIDKGAVFSAACFNLPAEEVFRYLYQKQKSAIETAVFETGSAFFTEKELSGKSAAEIQFMFFDKTGQNFDNYPADFKHGAACISEDGIWKIDREMPILRDENRGYIDPLFGNC